LVTGSYGGCESGFKNVPVVSMTERGRVMREFEGDLLIGGMKLSHIHGELDMESHEDDAHDWIFSGRLVLTLEECANLECKRRYRLELADGRAGPVILSSLEPTGDGHFVAVFDSLESPVLQS
jgi:hypothetical protein